MRRLRRTCRKPAASVDVPWCPPAACWRWAAAPPAPAPAPVSPPAVVPAAWWAAEPPPPCWPEPSAEPDEPPAPPPPPYPPLPPVPPSTPPSGGTPPAPGGWPPGGTPAPPPLQPPPMAPPWWPVPSPSPSPSSGSHAGLLTREAADPAECWTEGVLRTGAPRPVDRPSRAAPAATLTAIALIGPPATSAAPATVPPRVVPPA